MLLCKGGLAPNRNLVQYSSAAAGGAHCPSLVEIVATPGSRWQDKPQAGDCLHDLEHLERKVQVSFPECDYGGWSVGGMH
jgi:hypothetical protein